MVRSFLPALLAGVLVALPASAQDEGPTLDLALIHSGTPVVLGDLVTLTVRLTNSGDSTLTLPELGEDRQLLSFGVQTDDGPVETHCSDHFGVRTTLSL